MKNAKKLWTEVTIPKITKSEAKTLYNELKQKGIDALTNEKTNDTRKDNILDILNNVGSIFTGAYYTTKMRLKK